MLSVEGGSVSSLDILDVAIGTVLFFLTVSLLCSSVRELFELVLKSRGRTLERGLRELLDDPEAQILVRSIYQHGQIAALFRGDYDPAKPRALPSYIPAGHFATALLDIVARGPGTTPYPVAPSPMTLDGLRAQAAFLPSAKVQRVVLSAIDHAAGDLAAVKANLAAWYDGSMDRVSGWYKRQTLVWLFAIGFGAAATLNLDALTVTRALMAEKDLRAAAVLHAERVVAGPAPSASATALPAPASTAVRTVDDTARELATIGYPVGWDANGCPAPQMSAQPQLVGCASPLSFGGAGGRGTHESNAPLSFWLWTVLGWIVTAVAVCVGAPTWFDLLNKFTVIRSTVKPHEKSREEGSEDRLARGGDEGPTRSPVLFQAGAAVAPPAAQAPPPQAATAPPAILAPEEAGFVAEEWEDGYTPPQGAAL